MLRQAMPTTSYADICSGITNQSVGAIEGDENQSVLLAALRASRFV